MKTEMEMWTEPFVMVKKCNQMVIVVPDEAPVHIYTKEEKRKMRKDAVIDVFIEIGLFILQGVSYLLMAVSVAMFMVLLSR